MSDLQSEGIISSRGYVNRWGDYVSRSGSKSFNVRNIKKEIDKGNPIIIKGRSNSSTHYVVAYDYSGSDIEIMDPWNGETGVLGTTTLKSWSGYYVCT